MITPFTRQCSLPNGHHATPTPTRSVWCISLSADSVFARTENYKEPYVLRPEPANADYQRSIEEGTGIPELSLAAVPLLSGDLTTGTLGFAKLGDREWLPEELNALQAIATLFAQLQARIVAEERVRYLAEHDDLTGLFNRRALIAHLDERLAEGQSGEVAVLFLDLDRFKVVNEHLGQDAGDRFIKGFAEFLREAADVSAVTRPASVVMSLSSCRLRRWTSKAPWRSRIGCRSRLKSRS